MCFFFFPISFFMIFNKCNLERKYWTSMIIPVRCFTCGKVSAPHGAVLLGYASKTLLSTFHPPAPNTPICYPCFAVRTSIAFVKNKFIFFLCCCVLLGPSCVLFVYSTRGLYPADVGKSIPDLAWKWSQYPLCMVCYGWACPNHPGCPSVLLQLSHSESACYISTALD